MRFLTRTARTVVNTLPGNLSFLPSANIDGPIHLLRLMAVKDRFLDHQDYGYECEAQDEAACSKTQREEESLEKHKLPRFWVETLHPLMIG
ncbi:MAG: hypothetical protein WDN23_12890 [Edaphobacter sp.]